MCANSAHGHHGIWGTRIFVRRPGNSTHQPLRVSRDLARIDAIRRSNRGAAVAYASRDEKEAHMLYTLAVILLLAWLLGFVGIYTIGAFVHVLLVIAIVLFIVGLLSGRRTVV